MRTECLILSALLLFCCNKKKSEIPFSAENPDSVITCSGYSFLENEDLSEVCAPFGGKLISVNVSEGSLVNSGQVLAIIENSDFLILQQEFLEAKNLLDYYSEEYTRQGELTVENATSMKKMQAARRDFTAAELRFQSLRKQLLILGLIPDSLKPEQIRPVIHVRSSTKGIIAENPVTRGSYVDKGEKLFVVTGSQVLLLKLQVPEKAVLDIHKDQIIDFRCASDTSVIVKALIVEECSIIDPATHLATVIAKPVNENRSLIPGMSVKATIYRSISKQ